MVPAFKGLGYAMILVRFFVNIYYVVITAWSLYYLAIGFTSTLPWGTCNNEWNTYDCYSIKFEKECQQMFNNSGIGTINHYSPNLLTKFNLQMLEALIILIIKEIVQQLMITALNIIIYLEIM